MLLTKLYRKLRNDASWCGSGRKRPWISSPRGPVTNQRPVARMRLCLRPRNGLHLLFPGTNADADLQNRTFICSWPIFLFFFLLRRNYAKETMNPSFLVRCKLTTRKTFRKILHNSASYKPMVGSAVLREVKFVLFNIYHMGNVWMSSPRNITMLDKLSI